MYGVDPPGETISSGSSDDDDNTTIRLNNVGEMTEMLKVLPVVRTYM